jgi:death-on-curing protein
MPEPQWLDCDLVDALHEQSLRLHGGLAGVRDTHGLEAALCSPRNLWADGGEEDLFRLAAHLLVSLAKAHGYSDGNRRIAIISAVAFLGANGVESPLAPVSWCPRRSVQPAARNKTER